MKYKIFLLSLVLVSCNTNYFKQYKENVTLIDYIYSASITTIRNNATLLFESEIRFSASKINLENYDKVKTSFYEYNEFLEKFRYSLLNGNSDFYQKDKDEIIKKRDSFYNIMMDKTPYKSILIEKFSRFKVFRDGFAFSNDDFINYMLINGLLFESANYFYNYVTLLVPKGE